MLHLGLALACSFISLPPLQDVQPAPPSELLVKAVASPARGVRSLNSVIAASGWTTAPQKSQENDLSYVLHWHAPFEAREGRTAQDIESFRELHELPSERFARLESVGALWSDHFALGGIDPQGQAFIEVLQVQFDPNGAAHQESNRPDASRSPASTLTTIGTLRFDTAFEGVLEGLQPILIGPLHGPDKQALIATAPDYNLWAIDLGQLFDTGHTPAPPRVLADVEALNRKVSNSRWYNPTFHTLTSTFGDAAYYIDNTFGCFPDTLSFVDVGMKGRLVKDRRSGMWHSSPYLWMTSSEDEHILTRFGRPIRDRPEFPRFEGPSTKTTSAWNLRPIPALDFITDPTFIQRANLRGRVGAEVHRGERPEELVLTWSVDHFPSDWPEQRRTQSVLASGPILGWAHAQRAPHSPPEILVLSEEPVTGRRLVQRLQIPPPEAIGPTAAIELEALRNWTTIYASRPSMQEDPVLLVEHPRKAGSVLMLTAQTSTLVELEAPGLGLPGLFTSDLPKPVLTATEEPVLASRFDAVRATDHPEYGPSIELHAANDEGELELALVIAFFPSGRARVVWEAGY